MLIQLIMSYSVRWSFYCHSFNPLYHYSTICTEVTMCKTTKWWRTMLHSLQARIIINSNPLINYLKEQFMNKHNHVFHLWNTQYFDVCFSSWNMWLFVTYSSNFWRLVAFNTRKLHKLQNWTSSEKLCNRYECVYYITKNLQEDC